MKNQLKIYIKKQKKANVNINKYDFLFTNLFFSKIKRGKLNYKYFTSR